MQEVSRQGEAGSGLGLNLARNLNHSLGELVDCLQSALVDRVVQVSAMDKKFEKNVNLKVRSIFYHQEQC